MNNLRILTIAFLTLSAFPVLASALELEELSDKNGDLTQTLSALPPPGEAADITPARTAEGNTSAETAARCSAPSGDETPILQNDFHWFYTMPEMMARFEEMYNSPKRLYKRAYWDPVSSRLKLPGLYGDKDVRITEGFVKATERHIEQALELKYADAVFFPDMGHSHILIPQELWDSKYRDYPVSQMPEQFEDMFADPRLQFFYHTAEQLKTNENGQVLPGEHLAFRYKTRNIAGPITADAELSVFQNPDSPANTVGEIPGYRWWGAGFNFSAQKDGCFVYHHGGKTYRFDISLSDLPPKPGSGDEAW